MCGKNANIKNEIKVIIPLIHAFVCHPSFLFFQLTINNLPKTMNIINKIRSRKYLKKFCGLENNYHDVGNKVFKILKQK